MSRATARRRVNNISKTTWNKDTADAYMRILTDKDKDKKGRTMFERLYWRATHAAPYKSNVNVLATDIVKAELYPPTTCETCGSLLSDSPDSEVDFDALTKRLVENGHFDNISFNFMQSLLKR